MSGKVIWLSGLAGAGKSTMARALRDKIRGRGDSVVLLDGDELRIAAPGNWGYSEEERFELAMSYGRWCKLISDQGVDVICATISMFPQCHDWNRENIQSYLEVYLDVPIEVLEERDQKGLYSRAKKGEVKNVMGIDIPIKKPENADLVLVNKDEEALKANVEKIFKWI